MDMEKYVIGPDGKQHLRAPKVDMSKPSPLQCKEATLGENMYQYLSISVQCTCTRTFLYHGAGKNLCQRCRHMIVWEERNGDESATLKRFEAILK